MHLHQPHPLRHVLEPGSGRRIYMRQLPNGMLLPVGTGPSTGADLPQPPQAPSQPPAPIVVVPPSTPPQRAEFTPEGFLSALKSVTPTILVIAIATGAAMALGSGLVGRFVFKKS